MMKAQDGVPYDEKFRYIEVTGTSEVEIVPDEIHFIIGIKEYFEEEFDGVSKPEEYRTKVRIEDIESQMREALHSIGITDNDIRTQDVGDYWRERGLDFLIGKNLDITLHDFTMIDRIISVIDTKGVSSMRIGDMSNKDILKYHEQGKKDALLAARKKAEYMAEALGEKIGKVLSIVEHGGGTDHYTVVQNSKLRMDSAALGSAEAAPAASASDAFRTIKYTYSVTCRFALKGW
ncbi:MAG TPA: SIMPL domain-containing protein [Candidatus Coprenecus avistercoris]|uniref:SIMPL domain-containing protein n=1 Tax=Candidatus Coprenecus avistercoris TaxID=2840730 RepID=A0A9D1E071_9BACT|nr:SIMPL domain-containing protein [Candidatus Coprenecus avistercoris]